MALERSSVGWNMERTRGSRTVAPCLFALVLVALVKSVPTDPGKKRILCIHI